MGLFNINNDRNDIQKKVPSQPIKRKPNVEYNITADGRLQIDYYDPNTDFKKFYDTTRLIIGKTKNIAGYNVDECEVSWYGSSDCQYFDNGKEFGRRIDYRKILTRLDSNALQKDPIYLERVMSDLLDQKRVEGYLQRGMQDFTTNPCGEYIGEVLLKDYRKVFRQDIGELAHNLPEMRYKREKHKEMIRATKEAAINKRKKEIARLQSEIDALNGR